MRSMELIVIATLNRGKFEEFQALLAAHKLRAGTPVEFMRNAEILRKVEEHTSGRTYYDNAHAKCHAAFQAAKCPTLADDSGIEIRGLDGKPGVATAQTSAKKMLEQLKGASGDARKATARCVLVFMLEGVLLKAEGVCEGKIAEAPKGENGFGFDTIFIPDAGQGRTFAEMSAEEKNSISHRKHALDDLIRQLQERDIQLVRP